MRHIILQMLALAAIVSALWGCTDTRGYEARISELTRERDSIAAGAQSERHEHEELMSYIKGVELALDSIAREEHMLSIGKGEGDRPFTRVEMKERVVAFGELLARQRAYIAALEDSLSRKNGGSATHLLTTISTLRKQLDAKDEELARLRTALRNEKTSAAQMQEIIGVISESNSRMAAENEELTHALVAQNEAANVGYTLVARKAELEKLGILTGGGFLKKKKLDYGAFREDAFKTVDIRTFEGTTIKGKKAQLLTPAPSGSYSLQKTGKDEWTLRVLSPADFWSVSAYMVIQTD